MPRKPMPWFRFYVEAVHDRKLRRQKPETRWLFVACLAAARQSPQPGWLLVGDNDPMDLDDLADWAGMPAKNVRAGMDALIEVGVVDRADGAWFVPNWDERQYESDNSTKRTQKHRAKPEPDPSDPSDPGEDEPDSPDVGTTLERSKPVPGNGVARARERLRSVTETENREQKQIQNSARARTTLRAVAAGGFT
ncbi:MAG TPA: hypothetical protein VFK52_00175 [Nocardioidaceae bacterium]|nr:hypothetical protein [Nocardioidaceae bacterium]